MEIRYRVEINPSYEWAEGVETLGISHRELEVFALVTEGYNNKEIAEILHIKHQSVKNHMHHFNKKLNVKNAGQALLVALPKNLIKMRGIVGDKSAEVDGEALVDDFRKLVNGQAWIEGINEKKKRQIQVFFRSHGIDLDSFKKTEDKGKE